jgi:methylase of polypeptide subunit release factors
VLPAARFREIGLTSEEVRRTPPRDAALRDDPAALALRLFRDRTPLTAGEQRSLFGDANIPNGVLGCRLDIVEDLYLFSDWPGSHGNEVLPPGETTAILFRAARSRVTADMRVLDLACGSGTIALLLSRHVASCIGTDINPRAIELAWCNAEVNGIRNVDFRLGSLYEPVNSQRFDLVASQPPYVPLASGVAHHVFLHAGRRGDEVARAILHDLARHLTGRGCAMVFSDWPVGRDERVPDRAQAPGLRMTCLTSPLLTVESYARAYGEELEQHFADLGIRGVRQCLAICEPGEGISEQEVLPHEWSSVDRILVNNRKIPVGG